MTYNGRRGPNVSQYLRDLNTISPREANTEENFEMEDDLALFTNTQFFDFDSGQNTDYQAQPVKPDVDTSATSPSEEVASGASVIGDMPNLEFISGKSWSNLQIFLYVFALFSAKGECWQSRIQNTEWCLRWCSSSGGN